MPPTLERLATDALRDLAARLPPDLRGEAEALADRLGPAVRSYGLIAEAATALLCMPIEDVTGSIRDTLERIARLMGVQRGYVFLLDDAGAALADAVEWCAEGVEAHDFDAFRGVPVEAFPWSMERFLRGETIVVQDPASLGEEAAAERGACEAMRIEDYLNTPLTFEGRVLGWLGFDSVGGHRAWSQADIEAARTAADVLAAALERRRLDLRLRQERELANRAAAIGTLAAGLAHEINNPLTFLMGNLEFVEAWARSVASAPGQDVLEILADMRDGADRIRRIVRDLRAFSEGDPEPPGPVDVAEVMDTTLRMVANELKHRARIVRRYAAAPPVLGSPARLGQVLLNLLLNAAHAIPEGAPDEHRVTLEAAAVDGDLVEIRVSDTGRGIAPADLERIFDPFFTTRGVGEGMGIGLSISHAIVQQLGGTLTAESTPGVGTTLRVRLPRAPAAAAPAQAARAGGSVLVVDDEASVRRWLARALDGLRVVGAANGREALVAVRNDPTFDLVLCDVLMPELDGIGFYREVQTDPALAPLADRIVFITGGVSTPTAREFLASVGNPCLHKPFEAADVRALLEAAGERR